MVSTIIVNMSPTRRTLGLLLSALLLGGADLSAQNLTTAPARDDTVDWLMQRSTTAPAHPDDPAATHPATPFAAPDDKAVFGDRHGVITTSDGEKIPGNLSTTLDKPLRIWVESENKYHDVAFRLISSIDARIVWEREEKEWHFKESGSDIKEYSGKTYPAREMQYTVTLNNGKSYAGDVSSPIYLDTPSGQKVFILHKRDKGNVGQTLKELIYVQKVAFDAPASRPATQP